MTIPHYDLDVRPILANGGEPFSIIMQAVAQLRPGQSLRLLAPFKPIPLFQVLGARGFQPSAREIGAGVWEVIFSPVDAEVPGPEPKPAGGGTEWPKPRLELDNRDLDPPEPMVGFSKRSKGSSLARRSLPCCRASRCSCSRSCGSADMPGAAASSRAALIGS